LMAELAGEEEGGGEGGQIALGGASPSARLRSANSAHIPKLGKRPE
jgi:hypothetical protein